MSWVHWLGSLVQILTIFTIFESTDTVSLRCQSLQWITSVGMPQKTTPPLPQHWAPPPPPYSPPPTCNLDLARTEIQVCVLFLERDDASVRRAWCIYCASARSIRGGREYMWGSECVCDRGVDDLKPNSWTYNFIKDSGHNLKSSQTWGFSMDFLNQCEGVWFSIRFFLYSAQYLNSRNCKRSCEF